MYNLRADHVECELFVDLSLTQGTHNLTLRLEGQDTDYTVSEGGVSGQKPVLHLTNILYVVLSLPSAPWWYDAGVSHNH